MILKHSFYNLRNHIESIHLIYSRSVIQYIYFLTSLATGPFLTDDCSALLNILMEVELYK